MEAITKNHQSESVLKQMVKKSFPALELKEYKELTEGYFNVAYEVVLSNGESVILKVAPRKDALVMTYEKNIMFAEVEAMKTAAEHDGIPVPKVLAYDNSCEICDSPYFFMEKLEGVSLSSIREDIPQEEVAAIHTEMGRIGARINAIKGSYFGYIGQPEFHGDKWYPVFVKMMKTAVADVERVHVDMEIELDKMWERLEADKEIFEEVTESCLVHWDCWDGNIFVKDSKITGIIDWERSLYADPLLEVSFRTYDDNSDFQRGYGITLTDKEKRRALWYDIYMMILTAGESEYRHYETTNIRDWGRRVMQEQFPKILS